MDHVPCPPPTAGRTPGVLRVAPGGPDEGPALLVPLPPAAAWAAIHTRPRAEKKVAEYLAARAVGHYLPLCLRRRRYGTRVRESWLPALTGYLFYDSAAVDRKVVYASRKVARLLVPKDPDALRRDLVDLARTLQAHPEAERVDLDQPGTPVEVVAGPLEGVRGRLVRRQGASGLVICVEFVHQGVIVSIDETLVRPLPPEEVTP